MPYTFKAMTSLARPSTHASLLKDVVTVYVVGPSYTEFPTAGFGAEVTVKSLHA